MIGMSVVEKKIVVQTLTRITTTLTEASGTNGTPNTIAGRVQPLNNGSRGSKFSICAAIGSPLAQQVASQFGSTTNEKATG